jgi:hypothetical protein
MKRITQSFTCFIVLMLLVVTSDAASIDSDLASKLKGISPNETLPVIIRLSKTSRLKPFQQSTRKQRRTEVVKRLKKNAELTQRPILNFLKKRRAKHMTSLWLINGIAARLTREDINKLSLQPGIASIRLDQTISLPEVSEGSEIEAEGSSN